LEIHFRSLNDQFFTEGEILTMLDNVLEVLFYLRMKDVYHGAIMPENIFCGRKENNYKIANYRFFTQTSSY